MAVGVAPTTAVESRGIVGELDWLETISDNGTAVGLVDLRVTVIAGTVPDGAGVVPTVGVGGGMGGGVLVAVPDAGGALTVEVPDAGWDAARVIALGAAWRAST